jgi:hypothetical protein
MDDELRRLAWTITDLTFKLELTAVRELKAVCEKGVQKFGTPEFDIWECQIRVHRMRARELKAKILAAHARVARLIVAAELERVRSLQRPATEVELARLRRATMRTTKDQRRAALRVIRRACNSDRACERADGTRAMPKRPAAFDPSQQPQVRRQGRDEQSQRRAR